MQTIAFNSKVDSKKNGKDKVFEVKPYQDNPMCAASWLIFRDLYTFLPGMYNHIMVMMNDRMRQCELGLMLQSGGISPAGTLNPKKEPFSLIDSGLKFYVTTDAEAGSPDNSGRSVLLTMPTPHTSTDEAKIHTRRMFQLLLGNMAQEGQVAEGTFRKNETEIAEVRCMSWLKYVADKEVNERVAGNKFMVLSAMLNGILATSLVVGNPVLKLGFRMVNPSGVASMVSSPMIGIARVLMPVLWTPALIGFATGATLGVSGTFSALSKVAGKFGNGFRENSQDGFVQGVVGAFSNALFGAGSAISSSLNSNKRGGPAAGVPSTKSNKLMDTLSHYLVTNVCMYRIKTRFIHNGSKYVWKFDLGVDKKTNMVLMYHGMNEKAQSVTAYRDIDPNTDTDIRKIRQHKNSQKNNRRSTRRRVSSYTRRNVTAHRSRRRRDRMADSARRRSNKGFYNQQRY